VPLHQDLIEIVGMGVLTKGVVREAETWQWGEGGRHAVDEGAGDRVLLMHGQEQDMRNQEKKLTGDKMWRRELSPVAGGRRSCDLRWTVEEGFDDGESWGKTTARPQGLAMWKESPNGG
jgi:hypothetical protein